MLEKTSQAAINPQILQAPEQVQPMSRTGTMPAPVKVGESLDKAIAGLQVADDHQAPAVPAPSLAGVQRPSSPKKTKSKTLSVSQRQVASRELAALGHAKLAQEVASVAPRGVKAGKEPSVLEFTTDTGEAQRWFISSAQRTGTFGKFRIAVLDTPEGAPVVVRAIKEYRLDTRKSDETRLASPHNRQQAKQVLVKLTARHPRYDNDPQLSAAVSTVFGALMTESKEIPVRDYRAAVRTIVSRFGRAGISIPLEDKNKLMLKPKTEHIAASAIAQENELYPLIDSPLDVQASVKRDGRVYNFSELMRGELFDVIASDLSKVDRNKISRAMAREATARLVTMHAAGLVHRDIKPENLFVDNQGDVQLGDWGFVARLQNGKAEGAQGTLNYAAPEIFSGRPYDKSVDIYALGHAIAISSMGDYLAYDEDDVHFVSGGRTRYPEHEALSILADALKFDTRGRLDKDSVDAFLAGFSADNLPYSVPEAREMVANALETVLGRIEAWNDIDPKLCSTVLRYMVQANPAKRAPADKLLTFFEKLQPADSMAATDAKALAKERLATVSDIDAEVAKLQAFGKAYKS